MKHMILLRFKLFFVKKSLVLLFLVFPLLFSFVSLNYIQSDDFEIKTTIGIVDQDQTPFSRNILNRLQSDPRLMVIETSESEGLDSLKSERIVGLYYLLPGFQENVLRGHTFNLIEVQYLADNYTAPGITDLITPHFLLDILKEKTIHQVSRLAFSENPDTLPVFRELFDSYTLRYEASEQFTLDVLLTTVDSSSQTPLFSTSKAIVIRYFISIIFMFLAIAGFYLAMQTNIDQEQGILNRIRLTPNGLIHYFFGNLIGVFGLIFIMGLLQVLLLKWMFFSYVPLLELVFYLALFALSISLSSLILAKCFKRRSDFQSAIPYLLIGMWFFGGWLYSDTILNAKAAFFYGIIPGSLIKDHLLAVFLTGTAHVQLEALLIEGGLQSAMIFLLYFLTRKEFKRDAN